MQSMFVTFPFVYFCRFTMLWLGETSTCLILTIVFKTRRRVSDCGRCLKVLMSYSILLGCRVSQTNRCLSFFISMNILTWHWLLHVDAKYLLLTSNLKIFYNNNKYLGRDPRITEPCISARPWLFLLLKEGCGRNSHNLEHPQAYTFTDLLSWHRHHDWGGASVYLFRAHRKDLWPTATYLLQVASQESLPQLSSCQDRARDFWPARESNPGPLAS